MNNSYSNSGLIDGATSAKDPTLILFLALLLVNKRPTQTLIQAAILKLTRLLDILLLLKVLSNLKLKTS